MQPILLASKKIPNRFENYSKAIAILTELHAKPISEVDQIIQFAFFKDISFV